MRRETLERPAYMEYAANLLARREMRSMTLAERGLMFTMKLECWPNQGIPADVDELSAYLGITVEELRLNLPKVMWHFEISGNDICCPSLEKYRDEQDARIAKQAAGGRLGAAKTNGKRLDPVIEAQRQPASNSRVTRRASVESLDQIRSDQKKPNQPLGKDLSSDAQSFVAAMERTEPDKASKAYSMASNGN